MWAPYALLVAERKPSWIRGTVKGLELMSAFGCNSCRVERPEWGAVVLGRSRFHNSYLETSKCPFVDAPLWQQCSASVQNLGPIGAAWES